MSSTTLQRIVQLRAKGALSEALETCETLLKTAIKGGQKAEAIGLKGLLLRDLGRRRESLNALKKAVALAPERADFHNSLGAALADQEDYDGAIRHYRKALKLRENYPEVLNNLALIMAKVGCWTEAELMFESALSLQPQYSEAHYNLGNTLARQGKVAAAAQQIHNGLAAAPQMDPYRQLRADFLCPIILSNNRELDRTRRIQHKKLQKWLAGNPQLDPMRAATMDLHPSFYLAYQGRDNLDFKRDYASLFRTQPKPDKPPKGPLRIGMLVTPSHEGIFLKCVGGLLRQWGQQGIPITLFGAGRGLSRLRQEIQNPKVSFQGLSPNFTQAVQQLQNADLDLLYYWEIGSDSYNYFLPFLRPARLQVTSWGTSDTTGIPAVDYYLSCQPWEAENPQTRYSEKLILSTRIPTYYEPPSEAAQPMSRGELGLPSHSNLYLCPQSLFKFHPDFDPLLLQILERDPNSHILVVEGLIPHWTKTLQQRWQSNLGMAIERIHTLPRMSYSKYLGLIELSDIVLDTLYFGGGNTSYECFSRGTPIVTLPGSWARGRFTYGCYTQMELHDTIASDHDDYVAKATDIARNRDQREAISKSITERSSAIFRDTKAATEFETQIIELAQSARN